MGILPTDHETRDLIERSCGMASDSQDQLVFSPQLCSYLAKLPSPAADGEEDGEEEVEKTWHESNSGEEMEE